MSINNTTTNTQNPSINGDVQPNKQIDHLILLVHGIGKHEDNWKLKIKKINILFEHVCKITNMTKNVHFIGVEWHSKLHNKTDTLIQKVTPPSIPAVHSLINHTLLDILFWCSPIFSQTIYSEVGNQMNEIYRDFIKNNPTFTGKVHILAHSLGSMIIYDTLCHQPPSKEEHQNGNIHQWRKSKREKKELLRKQLIAAEKEDANGSNEENDEEDLESDFNELAVSGESRGDSLLPHLTFPKLEFDVTNLFTIGSPIGLLYTVRGHTELSVPKCSNFFNILDPSDPVAYLVEPLIDDKLLQLGESYVPHIVSSKKINTTSFSENLSVKLTKFTNKLPNFSKPWGKSEQNNNTAPQPITPSNSFSTSTNKSNHTQILELSSISSTTTTTTPNGAQQSTIEVSGTSTLTTTIESDSDEEVLDEIDRSNATTITNTISATATTTTTSVNNTNNINNTNNNSGNKTPTTNVNTPATTNNSTPNNTNTSSTPQKVGNGETLFGGHRFDYKLKPNGIFNNLSEYSSVPSAHKSYWTSKDVMFFIAEHLTE